MIENSNSNSNRQQCGWNYEFKAQALYYHVYTYLDYYIQDKIYMSKYDMCYLPYCSDIGLLFLLLLGGHNFVHHIICPKELASNRMDESTSTNTYTIPIVDQTAVKFLFICDNFCSLRGNKGRYHPFCRQSILLIHQNASLLAQQ